MKRALLVLVLVGVSACATSGADKAPPAWAVALGPAATERMMNGRALFSARCQRCHALPIPAAKSPQQWPGLVSAMAKKSGLSAEQAVLLTDYLVAASGAARGDSPVAAAPRPPG